MQALFYLEAQTGAENIEYIIHYDSKYACNMATGDWFPKTNYHIVAVLKKVHTAVIRHRKIQLQWVKGHSKVLGNDLADRAADRGRTALLPMGGRFSANGTPTVDIPRLAASGVPSIDNSELSSLQKTISAAADAAFDPIVRKARRPWISQCTLTLMDRAALARSWGHTAQEENIQNLKRRHAATSALQSRHLRRAPQRPTVGSALPSVEVRCVLCPPLCLPARCPTLWSAL